MLPVLQEGLAQQYQQQMSFRWSPSRLEPSDRSFLLQGNQLVATSIGITGNRTALSCAMNVHDKEFKYFKEEAQIIEAIAAISLRVKRWAFREIQKSTHYHRDVTNTIFLPEALNQGDYTVMSRFLEQLRTNRVGAYVKLNLQESRGYFEKAATLIKPAEKLIKDRLRFGFVRLKRNMQEERDGEQRRILEELDKISSIDRKESDGWEGRSKAKQAINITYAFVRVSPSAHKRHSASLSKSINSTKIKAAPTQINIQELLQQTHKKEYLFKNVDLSKVCSTSTKIAHKQV